MINPIVENRFIEKLVQGYARSPFQQNVLQETDAEIVRLTEGSAIAVTTDTLAEEISLGLYTDPFLIGWMTVIANLSDLAAVGASPLGILMSEVLPPRCGDEFLARLHQGIAAACTACGTFVLGGDVNRGEQLLLTGTAVGICPGGRFLSRVGCRPGDVLFTTNVLGNGNAFALATLRRSTRTNKEDALHPKYNPHARLREAASLHGIATSCMDTSDGVLATLDQLMRLNGFGFELNDAWESALEPAARRIAESSGIPLWLLLAGHHGEFELLFTVPPAHVEELYRSSEKSHWCPVQLGRVTGEPSVTLPICGELARIDTVRIRNLGFQSNGDIDTYMRELLEIDDEIRKGAFHHASH